MSMVDLGDYPHKLGVIFIGRGLLGTVDASTPYPTLAGWGSRMVLASCG